VTRDEIKAKRKEYRLLANKVWREVTHVKEEDRLRNELGLTYLDWSELANAGYKAKRRVVGIVPIIGWWNNEFPETWNLPDKTKRRVGEYRRYRKPPPKNLGYKIGISASGKDLVCYGTRSMVATTALNYLYPLPKK
jgi:hypothetical protein